MTTKKYIPLHILEDITNGFSAHTLIGTGGYGNVYKGVYDGREIAVKLLHVDTVQGLDDQQYINEVGNLLSVEHRNIVQLLGYSYETRSKLVVHNGTRRFSQRIYRVLCFDYLQGGSLDKCLYDQSFAPNWSTRYNIIKGICEGLNFLHNCVPPIWHLDLKPANILLDSSMEPKLADFGLSRLFTQLHTHVTERIIGTRNYMPPEFIKEGSISSMNDVFSFGVVMLEIMTGRPTGYSNSLEMGDVAQLTQKVLTKWSTMIEATSKYQSEELQQVKTCMELAILCVDSERHIRPTILDILDTLNKTETYIPKKQMANVLPCPTIGPRSTESNPLKTMIVELDNITNQHEHCSYMPKDSSNRIVQQVPDRETASDVAEELIIGRTEEKQKILSILSESITEEMVILPIYGIGGIGKTTLAQLVFNDTQFQGYSRVWVYVSQEFDLNKIGNSIISQLTNKTSNISNKQMLHKRLKELFVGNNILFVLDDLWEEKQQELDKLKAMLRLGGGSMVIVVTTRDEAIARKMCSIVMPYKLETLTDDMCWTILQQKSDFKNRPDKDQLEQLGKEISIKCGGMALAAQSLGYMLKNMTSDQWQSVRDNDIWKFSSDQEVLVSLSLSYYHMPKCLQSCFLYCAVFPRGHNIVKYDLIYQWIALGFAEPFGIFDSMQLCEKYVTQLLGMSFLGYSKAPSSHGWQDNAVTLFTMHDLVHDLARVMLGDKVNEKGNAVGSSCQYALLTDCSKPLQLSLSSPEDTCSKIFGNLFQTRSTPGNIKALFFLDCGKIELRGGAFSPAKCLHVLDLSECFIRKLPDSVGQLKQLRYLHAPRIGNRMIPDCITELSKLNYLNLRGSPKISSLPKSIGDMKGLMYLDLSGCVEIRELPISFAELKQLVHLDLSLCSMSATEALGGCTKLQYLNLSGCSGIHELPVSFAELKQLVHLDLSLCSISAAEALGGCTKLQYLNLSGCSGIHELPVSFAELKQLVHLDLSLCSMSVAEALGGCTKLQYLNLSGCNGIHELPASFTELKQLVHLDLSYCHVPISEALGGFTNLQYLNLSLIEYKPIVVADRRGLSEVIGNLTKLRYLNLSGCMHAMAQSKDQIGCLLGSISTLSNLEHLDLSKNELIQSIPESIGNLMKLHTLDLSGCKYMWKLSDSLVKMVSLKVLNVDACVRMDESRSNFASLPHFVVHASSDKCNSDISLLQPTNPITLTISRLENVKSVEEAHSIKLIEKQRIKFLTFQWTVAAERFVDDKVVLEKLVPPTSVRTLTIGGYRSVSIPDWLMGIGQYLPHLSELYLWDFPKCESLTSLVQLPNLRLMSLCHMDSLKEWNIAYASCEKGTNELMFPKLEKLTIKQCTSLSIKPRLLRGIPSLHIEDCDNVLSPGGKRSSHSASSSTPITDLFVKDTKVPMHQWRLLHHLPALRKLTIDSCGDLTASSEIIQHLSSLEELCLRSLSGSKLPDWLVELKSLQKLSLQKCRSMRSLTQWFGELKSLKKFEIDYCVQIRSLPDSIQNLTQLEYLSIDGCPTLEKWCKSFKGQTKLFYIREKDIT